MNQPGMGGSQPGKGGMNLSKSGEAPEEKWKCAHHDILVHDFFISYRVATEETLARNLFFLLNAQDHPDKYNEKCTVFLDQYCLNPGENWKQGFQKALKHAKVVILLLSTKGLQKMVNAQTAPDNLLLEYEYSLKAAAEGKIVLRPLLIDEEDGRAFHWGSLPAWPDAPHVDEESKLNIKETMENLFKNQGERVCRDKTFVNILPSLTKALKIYDENH